MKLRQNIGMSLVVFLAFVQGVLRTYYGLAASGVLGLAAQDQVMSMIETPVSNELVVIAAPFLLLGVFGLAVNIGLAMGKPWGYYGTMIVSAATIIYDLWAASAIQCSAMIGVFLPVILIVYLTFRMSAFRTGPAVRA